MTVIPFPVMPPRTYVEWSRCLECLLSANDDERVLEAMRSGTGGFESGAVENLARRLNNTFNERLKMGHDRFARQMSHSRDAATLTRALLDFRRQLAFLNQVAQVEVFPASIREHLAQMLDQAAKQTQESLEESAKSDRSGQTASCIRRNSLLLFREVEAFAGAASPLAPPSSAAPTSPSTPRRQRTLL